MSRIALITGCSSGLGLATAVKLAVLPGFKVYATARTPESATELIAKAQEHPNIVIKQLDVSDEGSVSSCVADIIKADSRIDVLINNAGFSSLKSTEQSTMKEFHDIFEVNFFGVVRTIKAVVPHMRQQNAGRIINISSIGGLVGMPFNDSYCAAKFAVEGLSESMATTLSAFNIHVSVVNPGAITSNFVKRVLTDLGASGGIAADDPYKPLLDSYTATTQARYKQGNTSQTPEEVAEVVKDIVLAEKPHFRYLSSTVKGLAAVKLVDADGDSHINKVKSLYFPQ